MEDDDLLPISALQHLVYCERQAALIHLERLWVEDAATAGGRLLHERVHTEGVESRPGVRSVRSMVLVSWRLGIAGKADLVEFHSTADGERPLPVEYKRGGARPHHADRVQLCAQALCLEEMLGVRVEQGALYYGNKRRRVPVVLDAGLRQEVEAAASRFRTLWRERLVPAPVHGPKCRACSLATACLPQALGDASRGSAWLRALVLDAGSP